MKGFAPNFLLLFFSCLIFLLSFSLPFQEISFSDENHLVTNVSQLQGSRKPSLEEMGSQNLEEVEVSSLQETLCADRLSSLEILLIGLAYESSLMIESKVLRIWDYYKFLNHIHVHMPRPDDRVTSSSWVISPCMKSFCMLTFDSPFIIHPQCSWYLLGYSNPTYS